MKTTTTTASNAAKNCSLVCARQSASAVDVSAVATMTIGKCARGLTDPIRSSPRLLLNRPEMLPWLSMASWN